MRSPSERRSSRPLVDASSPAVWKAALNYIPYGRQSVNEDDVAAVADALKADLITQGPRIESFERSLAKATGARFAVAMNSGTAALHAAYSAAGVAPGRSVLTSPITFVATANASRYLGGDVVFADIDSGTAILDPKQCELVRDERVAAVVPVHFAGDVAPMSEFERIARQRGWAVIEDAAHALGASYADEEGVAVPVGSCRHSDMCCFSFHPVKHVTTGEGGAVTTNDESLYRTLMTFRTHGITRDKTRMASDHGPWYYEQQSLGFNYRITDFQCALGESQLRRLPGSVERRREIAARYDSAFADNPLIQPLRHRQGSNSSHHLYVVRVPAARRRAAFDQLRSRDIGVNVHYIPVYQQPYYRASGFADARFPATEAYYSEALSLPMYPTLEDADQARVIGEVIDAVGR